MINTILDTTTDASGFNFEANANGETVGANVVASGASGANGASGASRLVVTSLDMDSRGVCRSRGVDLNDVCEVRPGRVSFAYERTDKVTHSHMYLYRCTHSDIQSYIQSYISI